MDWRSVLLVSGGGLALLIAGKFFFLLAENDFDVAQAPVAFLLPLLALVVGVVLTARGRRGGVVVIAVVALLILPVLGGALLNHGLAQQTVADAALVFAGIPLAVLALVAAVTLLRERRRTPAV
jgi:lipopolysaccharide export LptBFGC system permease protein LptF